jgi:hypothetical protein
VDASIFTYSLLYSGYNETSEKYEVDKVGLLQQRNYLLPQSLSHGLLDPCPGVKRFLLSFIFSYHGSTCLFRYSITSGIMNR